MHMSEWREFLQATLPGTMNTLAFAWIVVLVYVRNLGGRV